MTFDFQFFFLHRSTSTKCKLYDLKDLCITDNLLNIDNEKMHEAEHKKIEEL
ncbi:hypothetical protein Hanom_Chr06g00574291 [Helianthus anomalus]